MPVTYISDQKSSVTGSTNGTLTLPALSAGPTSGCWVFVGVMSNDLLNMQPNTPLSNAVTCGSVTLNLVDVGDYVAGGTRPMLFASPFVSGMNTTVAVKWINQLGLNRNLYAAAVVLSGISVTPSGSNFAHLKTLNPSGLFDGSCGALTTDLGSQTTSVGSSSISSSVVSYTTSAGVRTAYDSQNQPFIGVSWQSGSIPSPVLVVGATTITNGVITTNGQASSVVVNNGTNVGFAASGVAYLCTTSGACVFNYTSKPSTTTFSGCTVSSSSDFYNYSTSVNGQGILAGTPCLITTSTITGQPFGGWLAGSINSPASAQGSYIATASATGGLPLGIFHVFWGNSLGKTNTPAYLALGSGATSAGSSLFTLVPSTRKMSRGSNVVDSINAITKKRVAKTIQVILNDAALIRKSVVKTAKVTINNIAKFNKRIAKSVIAAYNNIPTLRKQVIKTVKSAINNIPLTRKNIQKTIKAAVNNSFLLRKNVSKQIKAAINNISLIRKNIIKKIKAAYTNAASITSRKSKLKNVIIAYSNPFVIGRTLRKNRRSTAQQTNSLISNRRYARFRSAISTYNINAYFIRAIRRSKKAYTTYNNAATASRVINRTRLSTVRILQLFNINRIKRYNKKASAAISNAAVVTRTRNYGRFGKVTISYSIASTRRRSSIRIAIATVNAIAKNIATRPFYIFTSERANTVVTLASVSETITNNVDVVGEFTNANDLPPSDYNEPGMTTPNDYNEPSMTAPNDYTEPDWPTGEDVVPT